MNGEEPEPRRIDRRRIAHAVGFLVLLAVVFLFVAAAVPQVVGADGSYVVLSDSMSPAIDAGSIVFVGEVSPERIGAGDVLTYETRGADGEVRRVTHRVVEVVEDDGARRFRTKGDATETVDAELVAPSQVVGVVRFHVPYVGYVTSFAQSRLGVLALVVVPAALLVATEIRDLYAAASEEPSDAGGGREEP